jgi:hypothetical protein
MRRNLGNLGEYRFAHRRGNPMYERCIEVQHRPPSPVRAPSPARAPSPPPTAVSRLITRVQLARGPAIPRATGFGLAPIAGMK